MQSTTSSAVERSQLHDVTEHRALRTTADERQSSELSCPRRSASERQYRVKPMLRNFSDLGPRSKKHVTYSTCDTNSILAAVTRESRRPSHETLLAQHQPPIVSEEDEEFSVKPLRPPPTVAVDDVKSSTSSTTNVSSQSDLHGHTSIDVMSQYVTPAQLSDFDTNAQLPHRELTACNISPNY